MHTQSMQYTLTGVSKYMQEAPANANVSAMLPPNTLSSFA